MTILLAYIMFVINLNDSVLTAHSYVLLLLLLLLVLVGLRLLSAAQIPEVEVKDFNSKKHNSPDVKLAVDVDKSEVCHPL